jgi:hypothetical protein
VHGYADQPREAIDAVNRNKQTEEMLLRQIAVMRQQDSADARWLSIALTHFEQGFMALNRSIFKPRRISLPGDAGHTDPAT